MPSYVSYFLTGMKLDPKHTLAIPTARYPTPAPDMGLLKQSAAAPAKTELA
jgi:hypothetical protein